MKTDKITKSFILKSSLIIMAATFLSKILGLVREQFALFLFGGSYQHDAFIAAFKLPNALRNLLAEGAFSAAFIPIFSSILINKSKEEAFKFANKVITLLLIISSVVTIIGVLFAYKLIPLIYQHQSQQAFAIELSRIMMPFVVFVSISAIVMGILNSLHHFLFPALAPLFANIVFITVLLILKSKYGIKSLAFAVLASGVFYFLSQLPSVVKRKFSFRFNFNFKDENVKKFLKSFFPIAFGMAIFQLNILISVRFSSPFEGAVVAIDKTFIILQLILSIFVTGISTVSLPTFSRYSATENWEKFKNTFAIGVRIVLFFTVPAMLGLMALNTDIAALIYRDIFQMIEGSAGRVQVKDMINMGNCLFFFAPGMVSFGCVVILNRAFQGLKKYYIPFFTGCAAIIANVIMIKLLINTKLTFVAIPLSISLSSILNMVLLASVLRVKIGKFPWRILLDSASKIIIASVIMSASVRILKKYVFELHPVKQSGFNHFIVTLIIILIGILEYIFLLVIFKEKDLLILWNKIKKKFGFKSKVAADEMPELYTLEETVDLDNEEVFEDNTLDNFNDFDIKNRDNEIDINNGKKEGGNVKQGDLDESSEQGIDKAKESENQKEDTKETNSKSENIEEQSDKTNLDVNKEAADENDEVNEELSPDFKFKDYRSYLKDKEDNTGENDDDFDVDKFLSDD